MPTRFPAVRALVAFVVASVLFAGAATAQLRVAAWNITNYPGSFGPRTEALKTAIYAEFEGRSFAPDVIMTQEFLNAGGVVAFLDILNTAPNSPGDWAAAPFIDGPDTDSAFFYRTTKVDFLGVTVVSQGGVNPNHPRNVQRYDVRIKGYDAPAAVLACYSTHMKAGNTATDRARRMVEAQVIRGDAQNLPEGWHFVLGGDFNIPTSSQDAYQFLITSQANNDGRFFDPINTPGSWQNNFNFRFVHTQDPIGPGGMDDRYDQILVSETLIDNRGLHYIGDASIPYSATTWNDPNHSYRAWGNDGTSFDTTLTVAGNTMVGPAIAQALIVASANAGHLPVFLDMRVPAKIDATELIDFGNVAQGATEARPLFVSNVGDVELWSANGIANLHYTMSVSGPFSVDAGPFFALPDAAASVHAVVLDTATPGVYEQTLEIASDDPDQPLRLVTVRAAVIGATPCPGDLNGDGVVDFDDLAEVLSNYGVTGTPGAQPGDTNNDGVVDFDDLAIVLSAFGTACD